MQTATASAPTTIEKVDAYIDKVRHLLPAPRVVPQLLQLLGQKNTHNSDIVNLISHDPSLTANVLRLSNSSYYGAARAIDTLDEAVTRLGSNEVYRLVVAVGGAAALSPPKEGGASEANEMLDHSITAALAAQLIAKDLGENENLAFTAGLLHDIGKIVLNAANKDFYALANEGKSDHAALLGVEEKVLGVNHAQVGGRVLERWKFPEHLVAAVAHHHDPGAAKEHQKLAAYVNIGNTIAYTMGYGYGHQPSVPLGNTDSLKIVGLTPENLLNYMAKTSGKLRNVKELYMQQA